MGRLWAHKNIGDHARQRFGAGRPTSNVLNARRNKGDIIRECAIVANGGGGNHLIAHDDLDRCARCAAPMNRNWFTDPLLRIIDQTGGRNPG